ncbi:methyltransferase domain-containing protein [Gammaproteobacteria bacterium]|nr:methyltransferase domain-containing protein [Gammaproteobacteria bacterium]MDC3279525.1 methyltransferase domain-containing protein [Gammaproteobacteria bacterium]
MKGTEGIGLYYDDRVRKFGYGVLACDAASQESLNLRYEALSGVTDLTDKQVLEVGCGFGDLGRYLQSKYNGLKYVGVDISGEMVAMGLEAHPELELLHCDFLEYVPDREFDVVLAQGIFYKLRGNAQEMTKQLIAKMYMTAKMAVAFTAVDCWRLEIPNNEYLVDPSWLVRYCSTLTRKINMRHDYHPADTAIFMYRDPTGRFDP